MSRTLCICNAFSANMLEHVTHSILFIPISLEEARGEIERALVLKSFVGHESTATIFSSVLGVNVPYNRGNLILGKNWKKTHYLLLGQYFGPRLPEGAKELPEGASIQWWLIEQG